MGNDFSRFIVDKQELTTYIANSNIYEANSYETVFLASKMISIIWHNKDIATATYRKIKYKHQREIYHSYVYEGVRGFNIYSLLNPPTVLPNVWVIESQGGTNRYAVFVARYMGQGDFGITCPLCDYLTDEDVTLLKIVL